MDYQASFKNLQVRASKVAESRARVTERLRSAKEKVTNAVLRSRQAGYEDPRKLPEIVAQKEADLAQKLEILDKELTSQENILSSVEV